MRILHICRSFLPNLGGCENNIFNVNRHLSKNNQITILTTDFLNIQNNTKLKSKELLEGLTIYRIKFSRFNLLNILRFIKTILFKKLYLYDIINVHCNLSLMAVIPFKLILNKPIVYELHNAQTICPTFELFDLNSKKPCDIIFNMKKCKRCYNEYKKVNKKMLFFNFYLYFAFNIAIFKYVSKFIVQTKFMERLYKTIINPKKIQVIYNGVSPKYEKLEINFIEKHKEKFIILFVGRLNKIKGVDILINAIKILDNSGNLILFIVGDGIDSEYFKKKINQSNLEEIIELTGRLSQQILFNLFQYSNLLVVPSLYHESSPNVILEAMSFGIPVIAFNVGGIPELIDDNLTGILIKKFNSKELAKKINYLYTHEKIRKNLSKNAREKALKTFSWRKRAEKFINSYKNLTK
jgi:glycosyltransferase involved in cell wall biosynthesis